MRKLITLAISILLFISFTQAQNLVANPGFEDDPTTFTVPYSPTGGTPVNWFRRIANIQDSISLTTQPTSAAVAIGSGIWVKKATNTSYQRALLAANFYSGTTGLYLRIQSNFGTSGLDLWTKTLVLQRLNTLTNANKYTISFWAKKDATSGNVCKYLVPFMTDGTNTTNLSCAVLLTGDTEWTQYSATFDLPTFTAANADADYTKAYFGVGIATTYNTSGKTKYSGVVLDDFSLTTTTDGTVAITTSATTGGSVTGKGAVYVAGTDATVVAVLTDKDYYFVNWTENGTPVSTDAIYTFPATSNRNLVANFESLYTSTVNPEKDKVSIVVNAQNKLVINANAGSKYAVYNAVGQLIETGATNYKLQTINYKLSSGVFVVKVGNVTKKVIVK